MYNRLAPGDPVIFSVSKFSTDPGPRAEHIHPAAHGETYSYQVQKFWRVDRVEPDGTLVLRTRRGKYHRVAMSDPRLRPARLWERWLYGHRFPLADDAAGDMHDAEPAGESGVLQRS